MKKANFISTVLGKMVLVFCLFAAVGLSNASAQTKSFKQNDDAMGALRQEATTIKGAMSSLSPASALYKYDAAKLVAIKSIGQGISAGRTTEDAISESFTVSPLMQTEETSFLNRDESVLARQELETLLQN